MSCSRQSKESKHCNEVVVNHLAVELEMLQAGIEDQGLEDLAQDNTDRTEQVLTIEIPAKTQIIVQEQGDMVAILGSQSLYQII